MRPRLGSLLALALPMVLARASQSLITFADAIQVKDLGPRAIACPRCDAPIGEPCVLDDNGGSWNHAERVEEAEDADEENVVEVDFEGGARRHRGRR